MLSTKPNGSPNLLFGIFAWTLAGLVICGCVTVKRYLDTNKREPTAIFQDYEIEFYMLALQGGRYGGELGDLFSVWADVNFIGRDEDKLRSRLRQVVDIDSLCLYLVDSGMSICPPERGRAEVERNLGKNSQAWEGVTIPDRHSQLVLRFRAVLYDRSTGDVLYEQWFEDTLQRVHRKKIELLH